MEKRTDMIGVRLSAGERRVVELLAQHEERTPSDIVRRLLRNEAQRLGLQPASGARQSDGAGVSTAGVPTGK